MTTQPDKLEAAARELLALRDAAAKAHKPLEVYGSYPTVTQTSAFTKAFVAYRDSLPNMANTITALLADRAALQARFTNADKPKHEGDPMLDSVLEKRNPEFDAWVASLPPTYWARYDLSAARVGWEAATSALRARCEAAERDAALGAYLRPLITWHHNPALGRQLIGKEICHNYVAELRCWSVGEPNIQQLADAAIAKGAAHE